MCMELKVLNSLCYFCAGNDVWKICVRIGGFSVLRLMHKYSLGESDACSRVDCLKHFRSWPENQIIGPGYRGLRLWITRFFLYHMVSQYFHGTQDVHHHDTLMAPRNPVFTSNLLCFLGWRANNASPDSVTEWNWPGGHWQTVLWRSRVSLGNNATTALAFEAVTI